MSNPSLSEDTREQLLGDLMSARRALHDAKADKDAAAMRKYRAAIDRAKRALGQRGPVWWSDGAPDFNRHMAVNTPYKPWYDALAEHGPV